LSRPLYEISQKPGKGALNTKSCGVAVLQSCGSAVRILV
jgi:hypothetical protein